LSQIGSGLGGSTGPGSSGVFEPPEAAAMMIIITTARIIPPPI